MCVCVCEKCHSLYFSLNQIKCSPKPQYSRTTYSTKERIDVFSYQQSCSFFYNTWGYLLPVFNLLLLLAFPQRYLSGLYFSKKPKYHTPYTLKVNFYMCPCIQKPKVQREQMLSLGYVDLCVCRTK